MTTWYRAHTNPEPRFVFSGDGGLYAQGRWNHLGRRVIYCSESIALATMEWLSHNGLSISGFNYHRYSMEIPDVMVTRFESKDLPKNWLITPATHSTRDFAEIHLFAPNGPLAVCVPSVLVPEERNLIINPLHADFIAVSSSIKSLGQYHAPVRV